MKKTTENRVENFWVFYFACFVSLRHKGKVTTTASADYYIARIA